MDGNFFEALNKEYMPEINPDIADGLATKAMSGVELYLDRIIRSAAPGFPEGLEYGWASKGGIGFERCTPKEEFHNAIRKKMGRSTFELASSDLYMIKLYFTFKGEEIKIHDKANASCYLYLPYVRDAGIMSLRGSTFAISPVIADKAVSKGVNNMFVYLPRAKLTFERRPHHFMADGERITARIVYSRVHNEKPGKRNRQSNIRSTIFGFTTMTHYLLCKFGLTETFKMYGKCDIHAGNSATINESTYPPEDWTICSSTGLKPRSLKPKLYTASDFRLAVPNEAYDRGTVRNMVAEVFYIADHFPERVKHEFVDDLTLWRILLGYFIWRGNNGSEGKLQEDVNAHINSIDEYVDEEGQEWLRGDGLVCRHIYDLFYHVITILSNSDPQTVDQVASMYGKNLMILRYAMYDITSAVFNFLFALRKNTRNEITRKDVEDAIRRHLTPEIIMKLNHDHGEVNGVSSPGDNKFFKITSILVQQTSSTGKGKGRSKSNVVDPGKQLHISLAEVGSYGWQPKSSPDGRSRINPFLQLDDDFKVVRDPRNDELFNETQEKFRR